MNTKTKIAISLVLTILFYPSSIMAQISLGGNPPTFNDSINSLIMQQDISSIALPYISNQTEKNIIKEDSKYRNENIYGKNIF